MSEENKRKIAIPGEVIFSGDNYLPGDGTEKRGEDIVSVRYGLADETNRLVRVIPLSGVYHPRKGNVVIGKVDNVTHFGWFVDIGAPDGAFLPVSEVPRYVNQKALDEVMDIGDMVVAKIKDISKRGIDLTVKGKGLGRISEGIIMHINSNKVPRVIGKEGSMVNLIKEHTNCNITIGQNGYISISGSSVDDELLSKKAILFIVEKSYINGLTEEITKWFESEKKKIKE